MRYFTAIVVPPSVVAEISRHGFGEELKVLQEAAVIVIEDLSPIETQRAQHLADLIAQSPLTSDPLPSNHLPEAEALALMTRSDLRPERVLLDERAARQVATAEGIALTGFVGVLLLACEERLLNSASLRAVLEMCRQQGTHYGPNLVDTACQLCEEMWS